MVISLQKKDFAYIVVLKIMEVLVVMNVDMKKMMKEKKQTILYARIATHIIIIIKQIQFQLMIKLYILPL